MPSFFRVVSSADSVLFTHQLLFLMLHWHHLHSFEHPRQGTLALATAEVLLCSREHIFVEGWHMHARAMLGGMPRWIVPAMAHVLPVLLVGAFLHLTPRPFWDALIVTLPELIRMLARQYVLVEPSGFAERLQSVVYVAFDAALVVGVLPALFARSDPILHEPRESVRIALIVFANTLIISLLHLLPAVVADMNARGEGGGKSAGAGNNGAGGGSNGTWRGGDYSGRAFLWLIPATAPHRRAVLVWESMLPEMRLCAGGRTFELPAEGRALEAELERTKGVVAARSGGDAGGGSGESAARGGLLPPPSSLLGMYLRNADSVHLGLVAAQGLVVCALLVGFLYTPHWRSHAIALGINYTILAACIYTRRESAAARRLTDA